MAAEEPNSGVVWFEAFVRKNGITPTAKAVDIGSGKGRNALYFAKKGFEVYALDYIQEAIEITHNKAEQAGVTHLIHLYQIPIDKQWPFKDNFFDLAIDSFSSIDIESYKGRVIYRDEMFRTLKPKGYAFVSVVSALDEIEAELIQKSPGKEKNSALWPSGKFQKDYEEKELREFYSSFRIIALEEKRKPAFKLGRHYTATNYWLILQKL